MIEFYEGSLGGGKTYCAVVRILEHFAAGGVVATNITLEWDSVVAYVQRAHGVTLQASQYWKLKNEELTNFHRNTPSGTQDMAVLIVIDEAHLYWNSRAWKDTQDNQSEMLAFLTQSRKFATDLIIITQSIRNVDTQFVRLLQYVWRFFDFQRFKLRLPLIGSIKWPFPQTRATQYHSDGKTIFSSRMVWRHSAIFKLYTTTEVLRKLPRAGQVERAKLEKVAGFKSRQWASALLSLVVLAGCVWWFFFRGKQAPPEAGVAASALPVEAAASPVVSAPVPAPANFVVDVPAPPARVEVEIGHYAGYSRIGSGCWLSLEADGSVQSYRIDGPHGACPLGRVVHHAYQGYVLELRVRDFATGQFKDYVLLRKPWKLNLPPLSAVSASGLASGSYPTGSAPSSGPSAEFPTPPLATDPPAWPGSGLPH